MSDSSWKDIVGNTSMWLSLRKAHQIDWSSLTGAARADGKIAFFFVRMKIIFHVGSFVFSIDERYPENSCNYKAIRDFELENRVKRPFQVMLSFRDEVIQAFNAT